MLCSVLQCSGQPCAAERYLALNVDSAEVGKPKCVRIFKISVKRISWSRIRLAGLLVKQP